MSIFLLLILLGCASAKPNTPYAGPYPLGFNVISEKNPILTQELGKIPEIEDGLSDNEALVLEKIVKLYNDDPISFEKAFEKMYQIGLPEVRKYCSPLQALFWMIEDEELTASEDILNNYSLKKLLSSAWDFQLKPIPFSDEQISVILDNTNDKAVQELYLKNKNDKEYLQRLIARNYKYLPEIFTYKSRRIIKKVKSENKDIRWNDFDTVVERLNAPELIDFYSRRLFRWVDYRTIPTTPPRWTVSPQFVFKHKKGNCVAITDFIIHCLRRGGYRAHELQVPDIRYGYHSLCVFEKNGKKYLIDNGRKYPRGIEPYSMKSTYFK